MLPVLDRADVERVRSASGFLPWPERRRWNRIQAKPMTQRNDSKGSEPLGDRTMSRPVTLFTGQWADLPLEVICEKASKWGYEGIELPCWGDHFNVQKALSDEHYCKGRHELLNKYELKVWAISNHLVGQAVCDLID